MIRKLWLVIAVLFVAAAFALKANAQQPMNRGRPQGHGEIAQLTQAIETLEQQAKPLRARLEQIEAQAKSIREELRPIQEKIRADREKLRHLREEHREGREEHRQEMRPQNPAQGQTPTDMPQGR
jgi:septal ring factor EnvC (AmiA/AmiB activator)